MCALIAELSKVDCNVAVRRRNVVGLVEESSFFSDKIYWAIMFTLGRQRENINFRLRLILKTFYHYFLSLEVIACGLFLAAIKYLVVPRIYYAI